MHKEIIKKINNVYPPSKIDALRTKQWEKGQKQQAENMQSMSYARPSKMVEDEVQQFT